jgi:hypothetical protein
VSFQAFPQIAVITALLAEAIIFTFTLAIDGLFNNIRKKKKENWINQQRVNLPARYRFSTKVTTAWC